MRRNLPGVVYGKCQKNSGGGSLTREQFLLREIRIVAALRLQGLTDAEIIARAVEENLFQYPSATNLRRIARTCLCRLDALEAGVPGVAEKLTCLVVGGLPEQASQVNMYALMLTYPLVGKFMTEVVAERLQQGEAELTRQDINVFFTRLQVEDAKAVSWTEATENRIKSTLTNCLVQAGYLEKRTSTKLQCPLLSEEVKECIIANGDAYLLPAFGESGVR